MSLRYVVILASLVNALPALAFQIDGRSASSAGPRYETTRRLHLSSPIHEGLTQASIHLATKIESRCGARLEAIPSAVERHIVRGAVWNDDPLRYLPENQFDWLVSYMDGETGRRPIDYRFDHLYQSHFGPLQFLHAMGPASHGIKQEVLMWSELVFRIGQGQLGPTSTFKEVTKVLSSESAGPFERLFASPRPGWDLRKLFLDRCDSVWQVGGRSKLTCRSAVAKAGERNDALKGVSVGSLLHVIQDSYSASHVVREARIGSNRPSRLYGVGAMVQTQDYSSQDGACHGLSDGAPSDEPNVACLERPAPGCPSRSALLGAIEGRALKDIDNPIHLGAEVIACVLSTGQAQSEWTKFREFISDTVLKEKREVTPRVQCPRQGEVVGG